MSMARTARISALARAGGAGLGNLGRSSQADMRSKKAGLANVDPHDPYYFAVALSWPRLLLSLVALYAAINVSFALFYLAQPGVLANAHSGSFADTLFFSLG
jgi:hypothetical protein